MNTMSRLIRFTLGALLLTAAAAGAFTAYRVESMEKMEHPDTGEMGVFSTYAPYIIRDDDYGLGVRLELGAPLWPRPEDGDGGEDYSAGMIVGIDARFLYPLTEKTEQRYLLDPENPELVWVDHRFHPFRWGLYLVGDLGWAGASLNYTDGGDDAVNRLSSLYVLAGARAFYQLEASLCPYGELLIGYTHASFTDEAATAGDRELSGGGMALSIGGGVEYLLSDNLALDASLTFFRGDFINQLENGEGDGIEVTGRVFTGAQLTLGVGVEYFF